MRTLAHNIKIQYTEDKQPELVLSLKHGRQELLQSVHDLKLVLEKGKLLDVEIKQHREKRSLDANGMLWAILQQIAEVIKSSKDEVYLEMLGRYGVFTHVIVKPEAVERIKKEWRTVRDLGEVTVNGKTGIQLQCYYGSSGYNTKEFSVLLEGVISEAKELGIEVITESEKNLLLQEWDKMPEN